MGNLKRSDTVSGSSECKNLTIAPLLRYDPVTKIVAVVFVPNKHCEISLWFRRTSKILSYRYEAYQIQNIILILILPEDIEVRSHQIAQYFKAYRKEDICSQSFLNPRSHMESGPLQLDIYYQTALLLWGTRQPYEVEFHLSWWRSTLQSCNQ